MRNSNFQFKTCGLIQDVVKRRPGRGWHLFAFFFAFTLVFGLLDTRSFAQTQTSAVCQAFCSQAINCPGAGTKDADTLQRCLAGCNAETFDENVSQCVVQAKTCPALETCGSDVDLGELASKISASGGMPAAETGNLLQKFMRSQSGAKPKGSKSQSESCSVNQPLSCGTNQNCYFQSVCCDVYYPEPGGGGQHVDQCLTRDCSGFVGIVLGLFGANPSCSCPETSQIWGNCSGYCQTLGKCSDIHKTNCGWCEDPGNTGGLPGDKSGPSTGSCQNWIWSHSDCP